MTALKDHYSLTFFLFPSLIPMIIKIHEYTVYSIIINLLPLCSLLGGGGKELVCPTPLAPPPLVCEHGE